MLHVIPLVNPKRLLRMLSSMELTKHNDIRTISTNPRDDAVQIPLETGKHAWRCFNGNKMTTLNFIKGDLWPIENLMKQVAMHNMLGQNFSCWGELSSGNPTHAKLGRYLTG